MAISLVETKFYIPPAGPEQIARPRLLELMDGILARRARLALIAAPAGYGKTTLAAQWIENQQAASPGATRFAWLSLDDGDNDLLRFWTYVIAAIRKAVPGFGEEIYAVMQGLSTLPSPADLLPWLEAFINALAGLNAGLVLGLDDLHSIHDLSIYESLSVFLDRLPPAVKMIAATRSDPPLALARRRARGELVEIRLADLRFTSQETSGFIHRLLDIDLKPDQAAALEDGTEGWAAGLQMAGLALRTRLPGSISPLPTDVDRKIETFIQGFSGKQTFILDYLTEEVLQRQPEPVQRFLLTTSILDQFCAPLCAALLSADGAVGETGLVLEAETILRTLERDNLFLVPLDAERRWFRYHHLFADLLRARLRQTNPKRIGGLHRRAAGWFEQNGHADLAIRHALMGQDYLRAAGLVKLHWQGFANQGDIERPLAWLRALPDEIVRRDAFLSVAFCWLLWLKGLPDELAQRLADADRALKDGQPIDAVERSLSVTSIPLLRSILVRYQGNYRQALELTGQVLKQLDELPWPAQELFGGVALYQQAEALRLSGDLPKAVQAYLSAIPPLQSAGVTIAVSGSYTSRVKILQTQGRLRLALAACQDALRYISNQKNTRLPAFGPVYCCMADILLERNERSEAAGVLAEAMELGKLSGYSPILRDGGRILARLRLAEADPDGARQAMQEVVGSALKTTVPTVIAEARAYQARLAIDLGELSEAQDWAQGAGLSTDDDLPPDRLEVEWLTFARLLLALEHPEVSIWVLDRRLAVAEAEGRMGAALEMWILRARARHLLGLTELAREDLLRAIQWGSEQGYLRIFLDEGPALSPLLLAVNASAPPPVREYIHALRSAARDELASGEPDATGTTEPLPAETETMIEALTARELAILRLLNDGLSNRQVAEKIFVTEGTVKTHVHNLCAKLGVQSRTQAIARARQLKLI